MSMIELPEYKEVCSREKSRIARKLAQVHILQPAAEAGVIFSNDCPFRPEVDQYLEHETHGKVQTYRGFWQCPYSGKIFKSERYIDFHLQRFWKHKIAAEATECLANWCDVLGCTSVSNKEIVSKNVKKAIADINHIAIGEKTEDEHRIEHKCRAVLHRCFSPTSGRSSHRFKDAVFDALCLTSSRDERDLNALKMFPNQPKMFSIWTMLRYIFLILATSASAVFYICYFLQKVDSRVDHDLLVRKKI
jgi:hypothetical protein